MANGGYSGKRAQELRAAFFRDLIDRTKIVDVTDTGKTAINPQALSKELAKLEDYRIVEYPKQKDPFEEIMSEFGADVKAYVIEEELGTSFKYYNRLKQLTKMQGVQTRLPFVVDIH